MKKTIVIIGMGEMGGVFARAFLRRGHPVIPVTREQDIQQIAVEIPAPELVLLAVAEKDLHPTLTHIPKNWRRDLVLIQNELLPRDWQQHDINNPTIISVWFEKKKGQDYKVIIPSPVFGPHATTAIQALASLDIPCDPVTDIQQLTFELVRKNVYILTTNIAGLVTGGTVSELWQQHRQLAEEVGSEIIDIQDWLIGQQSDRQALINAMALAFAGDPDHRCMGRSAPDRLKNAIALADEARLPTPRLREILAETVTDA